MSTEVSKMNKEGGKEEDRIEKDKHQKKKDTV